MSGESKLVPVRVLPRRSLSLNAGRGDGLSYVAGDVVELPPDEARQLVKDGIVEAVKR